MISHRKTGPFGDDTDCTENLFSNWNYMYQKAGAQALLCYVWEHNRMSLYTNEIINVQLTVTENMNCMNVCRAVKEGTLLYTALWFLQIQYRRTQIYDQ